MISKNRLKAIAALRKKKFRKQEEKFLVEGIRMCREALSSDFEIEALILSNDRSRSDEDSLRNRAEQRNIEIIEISANNVNSLAETVNSQGVFCVVHQQHAAFENLDLAEMNIVLILDSGQDPGNVGTIIRTCDWFGVDAVLLSRDTAELYNPKVIRATMGSLFHLPIFEDIDLENTLTYLKQKNFTFYGADVNGETMVNQTSYQFPLALVIGNENRGLSPQITNFLDTSVAIPRKGNAESLNMAVASAIILSHIVNR